MPLSLSLSHSKDIFLGTNGIRIPIVMEEVPPQMAHVLKRHSLSCLINLLLLLINWFPPRPSLCVHTIQTGFSGIYSTLASLTDFPYGQLCVYSQYKQVFLEFIQASLTIPSTANSVCTHVQTGISGIYSSLTNSLHCHYCIIIPVYTQCKLVFLVWGIPN